MVPNIQKGEKVKSIHPQGSKLFVNGIEEKDFFKLAVILNRHILKVLCVTVLSCVNSLLHTVFQAKRNMYIIFCKLNNVINM